MKIRKNIFRIASLFTVFAVGLGAFIYHNAARKEADAYSASELPTTIDLNDYTEQEIRSYYSSLNSLSTSERQGTNLLIHLKDLLKTGQQYFNYDSGDNVWKIYEIIDRDWVKSPAYDISHGTYNPNTNKITNYKYGSSGDNPYIHALYVNRNVNNQTRAWGDHTQTNWGINREHIWAKSQGFQASGAGGARGDPMHLWAGNGYANNIHSNYFFGFVDTSETYTDCGSEYSFLRGNLRGKSLNGNDSSKTVFEPQDCDKGDIARAIFYMAARYNFLSGSDSDGIGTNNPNLRLTNNLSDWKSSGDTSTTTKSFGMGLLSDLLAWNKLDPVDEFEIHRNNLLYRNYTKNRNPFIDFPNWADAIWGTANPDGSNYNSTVTTYATPATDPIGSSSSIDPVFGISSSHLDLEVGRTSSIWGMNTEDSITWTVEDDTVAELSRTTSIGNQIVTITALAAGTTTITATCGDESATCMVTVRESTSGGELTKIAAYDFSTGNTSTSSYNCDGLLARFHSSSSDDFTDIVTEVTDAHNVYAGYSNYLNYGIKMGTNSQMGTIEFSLSTDVTRVVLNAAGWKPNDRIDINEADSQQPGVAYTADNPFKTLTFDIDRTREIEINSANRCFIRSIEFYSNVTPTPVEETPNDYLTSVNRVSGLYGEESIVQTTGPVSDAINISTLGLENAEDIIDLDLGCSVTLNGDLGTNSSGNTPKYYTNDNTIRVYKNNTVTFESSSEITEITFTVQSGYSISNVSASTGSIEGDTWSGSATSITFTNNGDSQFRFKAVSITHIATRSSISITGMAFKFGATIPQDDWDAIADKWEISDYGVMIVKENTLVNTYHEDTVEDAFKNNKRLQNLHKQDGDTPYTSESDYLFTVRLNIGDNIAHNLRFCASPYIVIDDVYYFLGEIRCNINELAEACLTSGETNLSDDALTYLSTH